MVNKISSVRLVRELTELDPMRQNGHVNKTHTRIRFHYDSDFVDIKAVTVPLL